MNDKAAEAGWNQEDLVKIHVTLDPEEDNAAGEYLWTLPIEGEGDLYRIMNVPFSAYMLAIGDIVRVGPAVASENCQHGDVLACSYCRAPEFIEIVTPSGDKTGRLVFETHLSDEERQKIAVSVSRAGGRIEWFDQHLASYSVPEDKTVREIVGEWVYNRKIAITDLADTEETDDQQDQQDAAS